MNPARCCILHEIAPDLVYSQSIHLNSKTSAMIMGQSVVSGTVRAVVVEAQNEFLTDTPGKQRVWIPQRTLGESVLTLPSSLQT